MQNSPSRETDLCYMQKSEAQTKAGIDLWNIRALEYYFMIVRIVGINLPPKKRIEIGLTYIFGIGRSLAVKILKKANIDKNKLVENLSIEDVSKLKKIIEEDNYITGGELKRSIILNIKRLKDIGCYRGVRHAKGLPVRGQRTRTNSRTVRGNVRKTFGSGKRPAAKKT